MTEKSTDPMALWQKTNGELEKGLNAFANQAMSSPEFSKLMNQAGGITADAQKQFGDREAKIKDEEATRNFCIKAVESALKLLPLAWLPLWLMTSRLSQLMRCGMASGLVSRSCSGSRCCGKFW